MSDFIDLKSENRRGQDDATFLVVDRYFENKERHVDQGLDILKEFMGHAEGLAREFLAFQRERLAARNAPVNVTMSDVMKVLFSLREEVVGKKNTTDLRDNESEESELKNISKQLSNITSVLSALESRVRQIEERGAGVEADGESAAVTSNKNAGSWGKLQDTTNANQRNYEDFIHNYKNLFSPASKKS